MPELGAVGSIPSEKRTPYLGRAVTAEKSGSRPGGGLWVLRLPSAGAGAGRDPRFLSPGGVRVNFGTVSSRDACFHPGSTAPRWSSSSARAEGERNKKSFFFLFIIDFCPQIVLNKHEAGLPIWFGLVHGLAEAAPSSAPRR